MSNPIYSTADMWLVYADDGGKLHHQPWSDLATVGILIEGSGPAEGNDMELIGWTTTAPPTD